MKKSEIQFIKYDDNYIIELQEDYTNNELISFYLLNVNYGIKMLMFGINKKDVNDEFIVNLINNNIIDYIEFYREEYED